MATQSTETNDICDGATLVERHELYYFDFAVFQVQHKLFRVPTNAFLASNPSFFEIFATPKLASNADVPECQSELQPSIIKPQDVSADHFQGLLLVLYPFTRTAETFEEWIGALDLATRWSLPDIRVKAIRALSSPIVGGEKSAAEFAVIARRYHIKEWLLRAFVELVLSEDLSLNSISQEALDPEGLDWETLARLFSIRLQLIQWIRTRLACFVCGKKEWFCSDDCRSTDSSHSSESTRVRAKTRILEVFAEEFEGMKDEEVSLLHEKPVITKQAKLEDSASNTTTSNPAVAQESSTTFTSPPSVYIHGWIRSDLEKREKPLWSISSYAPGPNEIKIIEGFDMSPEELRVKAVEAVKRGNLEQYTRYEANQFAAAEKEYKKVRSNIPGAVHRAWERSELVLNSSTTPSTVGSGILSPSVLCGTKKQRWNAGPKVVVSPAWPWNRAGPEEVELETIKSTPVRVTAAVEGEVKQVSLSGPSSASVIRSKGKQPLRESSP